MPRRVEETTLGLLGVVGKGSVTASDVRPAACVNVYNLTHHPPKVWSAAMSAAMNGKPQFDIALELMELIDDPRQESQRGRTLLGQIRAAALLGKGTAALSLQLDGALDSAATLTRAVALAVKLDDQEAVSELKALATPWYGC